MTTSREIRLRSRPQGLPAAANFELASVDLPAPGAGEVQVRNTWMTVDPYMRGRMNDVKSYVPPFQLGRPLDGGAIGEVIASNDPSLKPGDLVQSNFGWREAFNAPAGAVQKLDTHGLPTEAFLGVAGMPGLTAYAGLLRVAALKPGDVVFVSGAAGAVGSLVCQIAKLKGHKVIASAGGAEKARFLKDEIGVDAVIDYKATGDDAAALTAARPNARLAICGMISMYNAEAPVPGPSNMALIIGKNLRLEGFIVSNHWDMRGDFLKELGAWHGQGKLKWRQTVREGIASAPDAFIGLFTGANMGKMLVKLA